MKQWPEEPSKLLAALTVRPANMDDLAVARALITSAYASLGSSCATTREAEEMGARFTHPAFVDTLRGRALTMAWLQATPVAVGGWTPASDSGKIACLGLVAVDPMFTGLGIGRFIVSRVEDNARKAGFDELSVHALPSMRAFYECIGFVARPHGLTSLAGEPSRATRLRKALLSPSAVVSSARPGDRAAYALPVVPRHLEVLDVGSLSRPRRLSPLRKFARYKAMH